MKSKERHHARGVRLLEAMTEHEKTSAAPLMGLGGAALSGYAANRMSKDDENRKYKTLAAAVLGYGAGNVAGKALLGRSRSALSKLDAEHAVRPGSERIKKVQENITQIKSDPKWKAQKLKEMKKSLRDQQALVNNLKGTNRYEAELRRVREYAKKVRAFEKS